MIAIKNKLLKFLIFFLVISNISFFLAGCFSFKLYSHFRVENLGNHAVENLRISVLQAKSGEIVFPCIPAGSRTDYMDYYLYDYSFLCIFTSPSFTVEYLCDSVEYSKTFESISITSSSYTDISVNEGLCEQNTVYEN